MTLTCLCLAPTLSLVGALLSTRWAELRGGRVLALAGAGTLTRLLRQVSWHDSKDQGNDIVCGQVTAIASFHHPNGYAWGYIRFSQVVYKDGSQTETVIQVIDILINLSLINEH